jgi:hypothetical protein
VGAGRELTERRSVSSRALDKLIEQRNIETAAAIHVTSTLEKYELERFDGIAAVVTPEWSR